MSVEDFFQRKFVKSKIDGLDGRTKVLFQEDSGDADPFTLTATPQGITFTGKLGVILDSNDMLQEFARLVGAGWSEHTKLRPKIYSPSEGGIL